MGWTTDHLLEMVKANCKWKEGGTLHASLHLSGQMEGESCD
jgi:hypothetical protein